MLELHRMRYFNEFIRDTVDDRIIGPGEYYYYDPDDGTIISAEHYWELKKKKMKDEWDDSYYENMLAERDYREKLRKAEQQYNKRSILNRVRLEDLR